MDTSVEPVYYYGIHWAKQIEDKIMDYIKQIKPLVLTITFSFENNKGNDFSDTFQKFLDDYYYYNRIIDLYFCTNYFKNNSYIYLNGSGEYIYSTPKNEEEYEKEYEKEYIMINGEEYEIPYLNGYDDEDLKILDTHNIKNLLSSPEHGWKILLCNTNSIYQEEDVYELAIKDCDIIPIFKRYQHMDLYLVEEKKITKADIPKVSLIDNDNV